MFRDTVESLNCQQPAAMVTISDEASLATLLRAPVTWNSWQQLHRAVRGKCAVGVSHTHYESVMEHVFGMDWSTCAEDLSASDIESLQNALLSAVPLDPKLRDLATKLEEPLKWNTWQRLYKVVFGKERPSVTFATYKALMAQTFGSGWAHRLQDLQDMDAEQMQTIARLMKNTDAPVEEALAAYSCVLEKLPASLCWNDWQRIFSTDQVLAGYGPYVLAMERVFGRAWQLKIGTLSAVDVAELHHRVLSLHQASQARVSPVVAAPQQRPRLRGQPLRSLWCRLQHLDAVVSEVCRAVPVSLAGRLGSAAFGVRRSVVGMIQRKPKRRRQMHPNALANLRPYSPKEPEWALRPNVAADSKIWRPFCFTLSAGSSFLTLIFAPQWQRQWVWKVLQCMGVGLWTVVIHLPAQCPSFSRV